MPDLVWYVTTHDRDTVARYDEHGRFLDHFVKKGAGGLREARGLAFGPDGHLHVASAHESTSRVLKFHGRDGSFLGAVGGRPWLDHPYSLAFGPDGRLYVSNQDSDTVARFDGRTGDPLGVFVPAGSGGLKTVRHALFGPDGNLYVASRDTDSVLRYDGHTGAFLGAFVAPGSGGLERPIQLAFGPDGLLYAGSSGDDRILRYHGVTGAFVDCFVDGRHHHRGSGLHEPSGIAFGPRDGDLYVAARGTSQVLRYDGVTGAFKEVFIEQGEGGLETPEFILPVADGG